MRRGWMTSPLGASDGPRTRDNLLGRQMLYQLSYTSIFTFHDLPPVADTIIELHTGLELLLRRYRSSFLRLADNRIPITGGISRNFSALRLCIRSHPFVFIIRSQILYHLYASVRRRDAPPAAEARFRVYRFNGA